MNTKPSPLPPPYTPAPYLAQGSFLNSSQLVYYFQDFYASLEYISSAPEHVFERLVGNVSRSGTHIHAWTLRAHLSTVANTWRQLNHAFTAIMERERDRNHGRQPNVLEEMKALELSNSRLQAQLAELKVRISESTIPGNHPAIGSFHTSEIRSRDQPQKAHSKVVQFTRPYPKPPRIAVGFTSFDLSGEITLSSTPTSIVKDGFNTNINSWCNTVLNSASCTWLEVDTSDPDIQCGRFLIDEDHSWDQPKLETTRQITFLRPYSAQPQLIVWIHKMGFHCNTDRRLRVYATDVTTTGFKLHVDTWGDSVLHHAGASWIACTANKPNVLTGSFSTSDLRSGEFPHLKNSGYVRFRNGATQFTATPRVVAAINRIDISSKYDMRLSLNISNITAAGMTWKIDGWSDTILYSAAASFIAFG